MSPLWSSCRQDFPLPYVPYYTFAYVSNGELCVRAATLLGSYDYVRTSYQITRVGRSRGVGTCSGRVSKFMSSALIAPTLEDTVASSFSQVVPPTVANAKESLRVFPVAFNVVPKEASAASNFTTIAYILAFSWTVRSVGGAHGAIDVPDSFTQ